MAARRVNLPAADDLFRPTAPAKKAVAPQDPDPGRTTGRVRHDEKVTVYLSSEELTTIAEAILVLRKEHDLKVDRGRFIREAVAVALEDLESKGARGAFLKRLSSE